MTNSCVSEEQLEQLHSLNIFSINIFENPLLIHFDIHNIETKRS